MKRRAAKVTRGWFPGHMNQTLLFIKKNLKQIDLVLEILDARAPTASRNEEIFRLTKNKKKIFIFSKADLADLKEVKKWQIYFKKNFFIPSLILNLKSIASIKLLSVLKKIVRHEFKTSQWLGRRPVRILVVGIPNVGKSTLINKLVNQKKTPVGDKPGITKAIKVIKVNSLISLLDTPGLLGKLSADKKFYLSLLGTIKESIYDEVALAELLIEYLMVYEKNIFKDFFNFDFLNNSLIQKSKDRGMNDAPLDWLKKYAEARNFIKKKSKVDNYYDPRANLPANQNLLEQGREFFIYPAGANWDLNRASNDLFHRLRKLKNHSWEKLESKKNIDDFFLKHQIIVNLN